MLPKVLLLMIAAAATARTTWQKLNVYTFEMYVNEFAQPWAPDSADWNAHKIIFEKELSRIRIHNAAGKSWKEGVNKSTAMAQKEKKV